MDTTLQIFIQIIKLFFIFIFARKVSTLATFVAKSETTPFATHYDFQSL